MPTPVYSSLLTELFFVPQNATTPLGGPGGGVKWVVRSIVCFNPLPWPQGLSGLQIFDNNQVELFAVGLPEARSQKPFAATMHQTVETGDVLSVHTKDTNWNVRVSGFALTLP